MQHSLLSPVKQNPEAQGSGVTESQFLVGVGGYCNTSDSEADGNTPQEGFGLVRQLLPDCFKHITFMPYYSTLQAITLPCHHRRQAGFTNTTLSKG